ncbi:MAG: hypothetical protein JXA10_06150 [Anaerolineae bacterium]|nr:hypothetical protein [Anaerolineae bacterium]
MQPGSQRVTSELNTIISDPSGDSCLPMGWLDIQPKQLERACMSDAYSSLAIGGDAFVNNPMSHVSGDVEEWT